MSDKLIELARECGASSTPIWGPPTVTFTADQLATFRARIRAEAMEEAANICEARATCPCNGDSGYCWENDPPREMARAIRAKAGVEGALK
jgi:hypothetical protein